MHQRSSAKSSTVALGFHVVLRLEDDRPIATTSAEFRTVARVVLGQGESRGLLAFGAADNHLHVMLASDRASAGAFARYVGTSLRGKLRIAVGFEPARIGPVYDQRHAYNTFHYVHRQDARHEIGLDPTRDGTSLPELLGLRALETSVVTRVRTRLPRVRREDLVRCFPELQGDFTGAPELELLADAAAAALALPDLKTLTGDAARARRAAVHAAGPDVPIRLLSDCLAMGRRAIQKLRDLPQEPALVRAVKMQALLRAAVRGKARQRLAERAVAVGDLPMGGFPAD